MRSRVLVVFETGWDRRQLEACRSAWSHRFELAFTEPADAAVSWDFDVVGFVEREAARWRGAIDGVMSSSDYPGAVVAGALASKLGAPGTPPKLLLAAGHKYLSRQAQLCAAPDALPPFELVDPDRPETWSPACGFPCFVKPVKGSFGMHARRVASRAAVADLMRSEPVRSYLDRWLAMFEALVARYAPGECSGRYFIAEGELTGELVTLEGFSRGDDVELFGIVDSTVHSGRRSFVRFDYPSAHPRSVQERMEHVAQRIVRELGLRDVCFNVEMFWDSAHDTVKVLEVNPRIAGQFGDLYQKVDGRNSYEVALALACGSELPRRSGGEHAVATSFPLRIFEPARVVRAPTREDLRAAEALFPGTSVWIEVASGDEFSDFAALEDGESVRYAVVNLGAGSREEAAERLEAVRARLGFVFEPLEARARSARAP